MKTELLMARRKEFFERHLLGIPHPKIIKSLQERYGGTERAYYKDWANRKNWLWMLIPGDREDMAAELVAEAHQSRAYLWRMAVDKKVQDAVRLGAWKLIQEGIAREVDVLQSLGILPKVAEKLEAKILEARVEHLILENVTEDEGKTLDAAARILNKYEMARKKGKGKSAPVY